MTHTLLGPVGVSLCGSVIVVLSFEAILFPFSNAVLRTPTAWQLIGFEKAGRRRRVPTGLRHHASCRYGGPFTNPT